MPITKRPDDTDDITRRRVVRVTGALTPEEQAEKDRWELSLGFEATISKLEKAALALRTRDATVGRYGSDSWYAWKLLGLIETTRTGRDAARVDRALGAALRVGYYWAEVGAKRWPDLRLGVERRKQVRYWSDLGVQAKREARDEAFETAVREHSRRHPNHSMRAIASSLLPQFGQSDLKNPLKALRKRVARILREKN